MWLRRYLAASVLPRAVSTDEATAVVSRIEVVQVGFGEVGPGLEQLGTDSRCSGLAAATGAPESAASHAFDKKNSGSASVGYGDLVGSGAGAETCSPGSLSPVRLVRLSPLCPPIDACEIRF